MVYKWSFARDRTNINVKVFATEPTISLTLWAASYHWAKASKSVKGIQEFIICLLQKTFQFQKQI